MNSITATITASAPRSPRSRSQVGGRRPTRPPSHLHSDCPPEPEDPSDSPSLGQRSVSLTTLQPAIIQPRMAQLETLEAKMASIEVSLSSTPRRKKNGSIGGISIGSSVRSVPKELALKELESLRNALRDKENIIQSLKGQLNVPAILPHIRGGSNNRELSEVEKKQAEDRLNKLKTETDNKRLAIKNLKMALERLDITDNIDVRIQQAELEYQLGREELNLLTLLEETRTLQLCLDESSKNSSESHTLYSCVRSSGGGHASLHALEVVHDPKSPKFGAGVQDSCPGLWIDWALDGTGLCKGDRLIEVNGKVVLNKTREDLARLLAAAPDPAQIVLLRRTEVPGNVHNGPVQPTSTSEEVSALRSELGVVRERAEETQKTKDGLVSDNIRLTHRISYLEEQVAELLNRKNAENVDARVRNRSPIITSTVKTSQNVTNINISSQPPIGGPPSNSTDLQIFQKGPQVTALVANLPGLDVSKESHTSLPVRSRSSLSNVSNTHIPAPSPQPSENYPCHKSHRHRHKSPKNKTAPEEQTYRNHHHHHHPGPQYIDNSDRDKEQQHRKSSSLMEQSYKRASMIVQDLTKPKENGYDAVYEKHRQKCLGSSEKYNNHLLKHYNSRKSASVLDFRSPQQVGPRYPESRSSERLDFSENDKNYHPGKSLHPHHSSSRRLTDARSVKSLDFDAEFKAREKILDYTSEPIDNFDKGHYYHQPYVNNNHSGKPRPTPPKKPLRLSLHKTQSLQSVETPCTSPSGSPDKNDSRKPLKRNHKGETQYVPLLNLKIEEVSDRHRNSGKDYHQRGSLTNGLSALKWTSFSSNNIKFAENSK